MTRKVEEDYDAIAQRYLDWSARIADDPRLHYLGEFDGRLPDGAKVLESLGIGTPDITENRALVGQHLEIITDDLVTMHEPDPATFQWVLARRG
ncbi:hypothetical protein SAMN04488074_113161 [Lentzea albidocapillata subsp. violacea]|uniref:Uncharacterized protein n=1 Tax=Lentzea albidocapillata subsp. violacea TaxID=128104 RepID=A0A1G9MXE3_9PSEU|nr:hypothetical protein [Lentzea albidocapillata]SDL78774.1 hypothetical protein SAMN04488074_113161 [Lentzea albidocapillata subsp. violacea]